MPWINYGANMHSIQQLTLLSVFLPLVGAIFAGFLGRVMGRRLTHRVTITFLIVALLAAGVLCWQVFAQGLSAHWVLYHWLSSGRFHFDVGFLIDRLTVVMFVVVLFVSCLVHIYSIGYMHDDAGYQRFFSYMSLFTFFMLLLVSANNFMQLFVGWEGVGLVSYLLIGFWFSKPDAASGSLKAFIVNRVGDFGFLLGIAAIFDYVGSLNYADVFAALPKLASTQISLWPHSSVSLITLAAILLFIGAMGKSAQIPLHVWLPESMCGPTPISALIHAATMVTAGVFMVARLSPLYEYSNVALNMILVIGATGALFMGLLALVENDIKRIIAYSTMSQLGYMMAANGASAYGAAIFHLATHACFKALLFLGAGAVIIATHHTQDIRRMGGLRRYLPGTYITFLIGALALSAIPPFSGFYSKDMIIDAVHQSQLGAAGYAYDCLLIGALVTAFYTFRLFFRVFHGPTHPDMQKPLHPLMASIRGPLWALAIPSVALGALLIGRVSQRVAWLGNAVHVTSSHTLPGSITPIAMTLHALVSPAFWLSLTGIVLAAIAYLFYPAIPVWVARHGRFVQNILLAQYGFDRFNDWFFVRGMQALAKLFFHVGDEKVIDHGMVDGSGRWLRFCAAQLKKLQSGYLYHYIFMMVLGLILLFSWLLLGR